MTNRPTAGQNGFATEVRLRKVSRFRKRRAGIFSAIRFGLELLDGIVCVQLAGNERVLTRLSVCAIRSDAATGGTTRYAKWSRLISSADFEREVHKRPLPVADEVNFRRLSTVLCDFQECGTSLRDGILSSEMIHFMRLISSAEQKNARHLRNRSQD